MRESGKKGKERKLSKFLPQRNLAFFFKFAKLKKKTSSNEKLSNFSHQKTLINQKLVF